jgi:methionyl-tRNA formyltransferase
VRLVFAGTPQAALPSLAALAASRHDVVAVLTRPDARAGRGRGVVPSPVRVAAQKLGIEVLTPDRPGDPQFQARLRELAPQLCTVVAYGALIPQDTLDTAVHGWVNLHFSLLPAWRGAAPVQHAIMAGDEVTGASTFLIEAGLDTGPVYGVMTERIRSTDTAGDLLARLARGGAELLVSTVDGIEDGTLTPVRQPVRGLSFAPKIEVSDAQVAWTEPALAVDRRIRACTPVPGAWTAFRGQRLKLGPVGMPDSSAAQVSPGSLVVGRHEVMVGTATTPVLLGEVQPRGKRAMPASDWARGVRVEAGERLGA